MFLLTIFWGLIKNSFTNRQIFSRLPKTAAETQPASNTHAHTMGGGASKANEEKLYQENQELREQLAELKAQQSSVDERSAAQQRKETQPASTS